MFPLKYLFFNSYFDNITPGVISIYLNSYLALMLGGVKKKKEKKSDSGMKTFLSFFAPTLRVKYEFQISKLVFCMGGQCYSGFVKC